MVDGKAFGSEYLRKRIAIARKKVLNKMDEREL